MLSYVKWHTNFVFGLGMFCGAFWTLPLDHAALVGLYGFLLWVFFDCAIWLFLARKVS